MRSSAEATRRERLGWPAIRARHPDRWVILVEVAWADDGAIDSAVVLADGASRDETLRRADPRGAGYASFDAHHTGRIRGPFRPIYLLPHDD